MKILLVEDVYKLGRAGDVKKVADGYGRNYLIPQGLAVLATPGALKQVDHIRTQATAKRAELNEEMSSVAEVLSDMVLTFPARAGETGKLYGSITSQMILDAIQAKAQLQIDRRQIDSQPLRSLGEHFVPVRLTMDLVPEIRVIVYREGELPDLDEAPAEGEEALVEIAASESAEAAVETPGAESVEEPVEALMLESAAAEETESGEVEFAVEGEVTGDSDTDELESVEIEAVEVEADVEEEQSSEA